MIKMVESVHSDIHALSIEIGQLMEQVRYLKSECRRHSGNVIEVYALKTACVRHDPQTRSCRWVGDHACLCRREVAKWFPEYGKETPHAS